MASTIERLVVAVERIAVACETISQEIRSPRRPPSRRETKPEAIEVNDLHRAAARAAARKLGLVVEGED